MKNEEKNERKEAECNCLAIIVVEDYLQYTHQCISRYIVSKNSSVFFLFCVNLLNPLKYEFKFNFCPKRWETQCLIHRKIQIPTNWQFHYFEFIAFCLFQQHNYGFSLLFFFVHSFRMANLHCFRLLCLWSP